MKFRKKPITIEAFRWTGNVWDIPEPFRYHRSIDVPIRASVDYEDGSPEDHLTIHTLEGRMVAYVGDWIIRGVVGELYPCAPEVFDQTYELVDEEGAE